ncbi:DNA (cytosine-5)-methyltransferase PliMCI [Tribolium castaneum]|uniref:Cytosine-specific methyltransferase n=1 Tax=Tribolium castaneum TaxID=7070 RepID=A0A139WNY8_TRICA|nr:PREDICTED: DNA (cytosine-5)-methyltransferase PliMCI-like [Tribolium castaneum]ASA69505.1 DNA methyltransferase 1 isoform 1 [Tribolium castaneum]KYB29654.1 DNA (cytosine-5)-methyltransferase PliMCI-like Protein [Tribolium castaneum]|eukprot:XP_008193458.1 PREDICTED: DNA (cytosine-5)-methyltransferase PliMCI-like [Tribolium castaneum]
MSLRKRFRESPAQETGDNTKKHKRTSTHSDKCKFCAQTLNQAVVYTNFPDDYAEESVALTSERLNVYNGTENISFEEGDLPSHKITCFSIYDLNDHLCPLDTGLLQKEVYLHIGGYIKPIFDDDPSPENGIATLDMGPIHEWFIAGFDGGEKVLLGIITNYAQYVLMEPSLEYAPIFKSLQEKTVLFKFVIEFLLSNFSRAPSYEELLAAVENSDNPLLTEEFLLQNAQFVCDQIHSFDLDAGDNNDMPLLTMPCVRTLASLAGVSFRKRQLMRNLLGNQRRTKLQLSKATATPLVRQLFEQLFPNQIQTENCQSPKKTRCGICDTCRSPDCGQCVYCKDMVKFGGDGNMKQPCKLRRCPNLVVQELDESDDETVVTPARGREDGRRPGVSRVLSDGPLQNFRESIDIVLGGVNDDDTGILLNIKTGDFVQLSPKSATKPNTIARVVNIYTATEPMVHVYLFYRGNETILGEVANPQELFASNECEDCPVAAIVGQAKVVYKATPDNWADLGGIECLPSGDDRFFYAKQYDSETATFTDYVKVRNELDSCGHCRLNEERKKIETPTFKDNKVQWRNEFYEAGNSVFLDPSVYQFPIPVECTFDDAKEMNESKYPEYYRKREANASCKKMPQPFCIGLIETLCDGPAGVLMAIRVFFRPENTKGGSMLSYQSDINLLFWSTKFITVPFRKVMGKCYVVYCSDEQKAREWSEGGPYRYYFRQQYDPDCGELVPPTYSCTRLALREGAGQDERPFGRPLKCLDVFAGCGGLSQGFHAAGVANTKWAIENDKPALDTFRHNNRTCHVFRDDCNVLLRNVMSGKGGLPPKSEVEMIVGGPPCQGFSGMNRFNEGEYSLFKNSLVVSLLSLCDYYRPLIFVLENVRNFMLYKGGLILKLTLQCLVAIGYQVRISIVEAGEFGVPQARRRFILIASAPGYQLPRIPEPQHVFLQRGSRLDIYVDGVKYTNGNFWTQSAPYRMLHVRDAIADLPAIEHDDNRPQMPYDDDEGTSHFQRKMRGNQEELLDHICKPIAPIVQTRIKLIPPKGGADWRNLPNVRVQLPDGTMTEVLQYRYRTKKQKDGEPNRGVCACSVEKACDPNDRQSNTLIPWCLPHTADRHNNWAGVYGRLDWSGYFATTTTNPEPMGKQGRVIHPDQNRLISVRECARSQGFPDKTKFFGSVTSKYRQIGNAVPPPLAKAIGLEIKRALRNRHR